MSEQNPFSLFDFLGYLIPGILTLYGIVLFFRIDEIHSFKDLCKLSNEGQLEWSKAAFFIIISYCLGHLVSYLSSVTVEKYTLWAYGYPSKNLLGYNKHPLRYMGANKSVHKNVKVLKFIVWGFLFPIASWNTALGCLGLRNPYIKELEPELKHLLKTKVQLLLRKVSCQAGNRQPRHNLNNFDFHRIVYHYVYENARNHQGKLTNYVALYGFLRSMAFITNVLCIGLISYFLKEVGVYYLGHSPAVVSISKILIVIISSLVSYIFYISYLKFYRRYTLEGLMCLIVDTTI